jgi:hypothetical protein
MSAVGRPPERPHGRSGVVYLVHVRLFPPSAAAELPADTAAAVAELSTGGVEHVCVHRRARPLPVVGMYLRGETPTAAEAAAEQAWLAAQRGHARLSGWHFITATAPPAFGRPHGDPR